MTQWRWGLWPAGAVGMGETCTWRELSPTLMLAERHKAGLCLLCAASLLGAEQPACALQVLGRAAAPSKCCCLTGYQQSQVTAVFCKADYIQQSIAYFFLPFIFKKVDGCFPVCLGKGCGVPVSNFLSRFLVLEYYSCYLQEQGALAL